MTDKFPNARFGDRPLVNWRDLPEIEDDDPDDEQIETPKDVVEMLGFDPAEDDEEILEVPEKSKEEVEKLNKHEDKEPDKE